MKKYFVIEDGRQKMLPDMPLTLENYMFIEEEICYTVNTEDGDMVWRIRQTEDCEITIDADTEPECQYGVIGCRDHFVSAYNDSAHCDGNNAAAEWLDKAFALTSGEPPKSVVIFGIRS